MISTRRKLLYGITVGATALAAPGAFAQALVTATTGDGPYYPDRLPLDTDNDLLILNDGLSRAVGEIAHLTGRLFAENGAPVRNAVIEIWQSDVHGSYIHTDGRNDGKIDASFQGYGRFLTDAEGRYYFRTIKPVPYTLQGQFRAPHIHVAVSKAGRRIMATQALVKGHEANARDLITRRFSNPQVLETLMVDYRPVPGSVLGEVAGEFNIRLGVTARSSTTAPSAASAKHAPEREFFRQWLGREPYNRPAIVVGSHHANDALGIPALAAQGHHLARHVRRRQDDARVQAAALEVVPLLRRLSHRHEVPRRADPRQHQAPSDEGGLPARPVAQRLDLHREQHHGAQPANRSPRSSARSGDRTWAASPSSEFKKRQRLHREGRDRRDARRRGVHRQGARDLRLRPFHQRRRRQLRRARRRADRARRSPTTR